MFLVQKKRCATCIYRRDSPLCRHTLEEAIADPFMPGYFRSYRACHHGNERVCCAGFWKKWKNHFLLGQLAQRLHLVRYVTIDMLERPENTMATHEQEKC